MTKKELEDRLDDLVSDAEKIQAQLNRIHKKTRKRDLIEAVACLCVWFILIIGIVCGVVILFV